MKRILYLAILLFGALAGALGAWAEGKPYTRNVAVVLYEQTELLDWAGPYEVWTDAANIAVDNGQKAFNVYTVARTKEPVFTQGKLRVVPDYSIEDAPKPDVVIIPGGNSGKLNDDPAFFAWAKKVTSEAEVTLTVCTGAFVMGKAGALDGLQVTTWFGAIEELQKQFPKATVIDGRRYVDNGRLVTTAGVSAGVDGSLHLIARLLGRRVADQVSRYMEYRWTPESYLAVKYPYLNPSASEEGRALQNAGMRQEENNLAEAAAIYRSVLAKNDGDASLWFSLARALRGLNDHSGAADAFTRAGTLDEHHGGWALYQAALEYATIDQHDRAADLLARAWAAGYTEQGAIAAEPLLAKARQNQKFRQVAGLK
jgi:putative intracellular protease/amidase